MSRIGKRQTQTGQAKTVKAEEPHPKPDSRPAVKPAQGSHDSVAITRAGMAWVATIASLILLVLLITFIIQNQDDVTIAFFGLQGTIASGMALLIAAVAGGLLVAVAGAARILQLRSSSRHQRSP